MAYIRPGCVSLVGVSQPIFIFVFVFLYANSCICICIPLYQTCVCQPCWSLPANGSPQLLANKVVRVVCVRSI